MRGAVAITRRTQGAGPGTPSDLKLPSAIVLKLRCPVCKSPMTRLPDCFTCRDARCGGSFPIVDGAPVLLNEATSLFGVAGVIQRKDAAARQRPGVAGVVSALLPAISQNIGAAANYRRLAKQLLRRSARPCVLVVGGAVPGQGIEALLAHPAIQLVETDVYFGDRTQLIADAHDLPFADGAFDGVVAQAVLEHVADPYRCVAEIHRVLGENGLVYAETPFMQQVHLGRYDFTRFTQLGHRRLFREFAEISSGVIGGPGMALAWACEYFLLSFSNAARVRAAIRGVARLTLFWLKYFDPFLSGRPGAFDAASGYYFLGTRSAGALSDRDLIQQYRGALQ